MFCASSGKRGFKNNGNEGKGSFRKAAAKRNCCHPQEIRTLVKKSDSPACLTNCTTETCPYGSLLTVLRSVETVLMGVAQNGEKLDQLCYL